LRARARYAQNHSMAMSEPQADPFNLADVPSVAEYKAAFLACRDSGVMKSMGGFSLPLEMLRANYHAPERTLTAGELAAHPRVDLASYKSANLKYGTYAKALCKQLNRKPKVQISILVKFSGGAPTDEFVNWTLLPEAAAALEALGWVKPQE
jgi:hypothetical protein